MYIFSQISPNACTSHTFGVFFFSFFLPFIYALSRLLVVGIHRQGVMTRKERGEDVYKCMLGQTLNDERSQRSNPINCTKVKRKRFGKIHERITLFWLFDQRKINSFSLDQYRKSLHYNRKEIFKFSAFSIRMIVHFFFVQC